MAAKKKAAKPAKKKAAKPAKKKAAKPAKKKAAARIRQVNPNVKPEETAQANFSENIGLTHTTTHDESEARKLDKRRENGYHGF